MEARKSTAIGLIATTGLLASLLGCSNGQGQGVSNGNLAPVDASQPVAQQSQPEPNSSQPPAQPSGYPQQPPASYNSASYSDAYETNAGSDTGPVVEASAPPPPLPEYSQPPCPGENYIWTPGYWNNADAGYYWVPGTWVMAPWVGALWTPPYWAYAGGHYRMHHGFWGRYIGFYGGINYGFGYVGRGYYGGYWDGGTFRYNRAVTNVNVTVVRNVYNQRVENITNTRVSFNGGPGGIGLRPAAPEVAALREARTPAVAAQMQHAREASLNRAQFAEVNRGRPAVVAATQPLRTEYRAPAARAPEAPRNIPGQAEMRPGVGQSAVRPNGPETRPAPMPAERALAPEQRRAEQQRGDFRAANPVPPPQAPAARPFAPENRNVPQARPEPPAIVQRGREPQRAPQPNREAPVPAMRQSIPENRPAPQQRPEARPTPEMRQAPAPQPRAEAPRPAPAARPEFHPAPEQRPAPQARPAAPPQQQRPEPAKREDKREGRE